MVAYRSGVPDVHGLVGRSLDGLVLRTPRLQLRPVQPEDAAALFEVYSDPDVMRFWSSPPWTRREQAEEQIRADIAAVGAGTAVRLAVLLRAESGGDVVPGGAGRPVGTVSLFHLDPGNRRAEIGYILHRSAWGRGYAQEAVRAVIRCGFEVLGLNRWEADIDPRNEASGRVLERLGFRREGLLRQRWIVAGEVSDSAWYGLLRQDWTDAPPGRQV